MEARGEVEVYGGERSGGGVGLVGLWRREGRWRGIEARGGE